MLDQEITYINIDQSNKHAVEKFVGKLSTEIDDPDMFLSPDNELLNKCLDSKLSFAAIHEGEIVAGRFSYIPGLIQENLGHVFNLPDSDLERLVQYQSIFVLKKYRGNGFGSELHKKSLELIRSKGFKFITATCHPKNEISLHLLLTKFGFRCDSEIHSVRGKERCVLLKNI